MHRLLAFGTGSNDPHEPSGRMSLLCRGRVTLLHPIVFRGQRGKNHRLLANGGFDAAATLWGSGIHLVFTVNVYIILAGEIPLR